MSINIYLNEKCKDAMNITELVQKVKVSLEDILYTKNHGFVKGINNIFV
jgi:arsenate reductase-like glutaredoxin family protein